MSRLFPGEYLDSAFSNKFWSRKEGDYNLTEGQKRLVSLYLSDVRIGQYGNPHIKTKSLAECVERHINWSQSGNQPLLKGKLAKDFDAATLVLWALDAEWPLTTAGSQLAQTLIHDMPIGQDLHGVMSSPKDRSELTPEQIEWISEYLTSAPYLPILHRQDWWGKQTPIQLSKNWTGDDLIRWVCNYSSIDQGKKILTGKGLARAFVLFQGPPEQALFRKPPQWLAKTKPGMFALVPKGHDMSLAGFFNDCNVPDTGWPHLTLKQRDVVERYLQGGDDYTQWPTKHIFCQWARLMVFEGKLSALFDDKEFVLLACENAYTRNNLSAEAKAWLRESGVLSSGLPPVMAEAAAGKLLNKSEKHEKKVFLCYAHEDSQWRDKLLNMLAPELSCGKLELWYDKKINPSEDWKSEITNALQQARAAVLLVSTDFLASTFINEEELPFLIEEAKKDAVKLSWVLVNHAMYEGKPFTTYEALHDLEKPLSTLRGGSRDKILKEISQKIVRMVSEK